MQLLRRRAADVYLTVVPIALYGTKALLGALRKVRAFHVGVLKLGLALLLLAVTSVSATGARFGGRAAVCVLAGWLLVGGLILAGDELEIRLPWR